MSMQQVMRSFQTELFSSFLPSTYVGQIKKYNYFVNLGALKHWQFMPNWKDGSSLLNSLFFVFNIFFLPKYLLYYDYIVKWCSGL